MEQDHRERHVQGRQYGALHADHANLGSTGLTLDATGVATITAASRGCTRRPSRTAARAWPWCRNPSGCPRDVREIAEGLNAPWPGATAPNPHAGKFGANHENIITNPLFTDANDWGLIADPNEVEILEAAYINGKREPEFFVADNPLVGQMFVADKTPVQEPARVRVRDRGLPRGRQERGGAVV